MRGAARIGAAGGTTDDPSDGFGDWRERVAHSMLTALVVTGTLAYVPGLWLSLRDDAYGIAMLGSTAWLLVLGAWVLRHRLGYRARAALLIGVTWALGIGLVAAVGLSGAGFLWLLATPVTAALLYDLRATIGVLGATALALAGLSLLAGNPAIGSLPPPSELWLVMAANLVPLATLLSLSVATLIGGLRHATRSARRAEAELLRANEALRQQVEGRQRAEERLAQSELLTAIGTLANGIAHEFNNLLTPILTSTQLLRADETDPERAELLDRSIVAARNGRDLVRRILAFSQPLGEPRAPEDAGSLFGDAVRLLRAALPATVTVETAIDPGAGAVCLSPTEAHQILLNLGSNAQHAMNGSGTLRIGLSADHELRQVCLRIEDDGTGMDADTLARALDPFFTTRREHQGTGLGLPTVHAIVTSAGGTLAIDSRPGEGTRVEIRLPRVARVEAPTATPIPMLRRASARLLLVEDEGAVRKTLIRFLRRTGYEVTDCPDAAAALERVRETPQGWDLVLTDYSMPGKTGLELARALRDLRPELPVVLFTGLVEDEVRREARAAGLAGIVRKPFETAELAEVLDRALGWTPPRA